VGGTGGPKGRPDKKAETRPENAAMTIIFALCRICSSGGRCTPLDVAVLAFGAVAAVAAASVGYADAAHGAVAALDPALGPR
jgi:hypothetical protein